MTIIEKMHDLYCDSVCDFIEYKMTIDEINELQTICYDLGGSMFPVDAFFNDIDRNKTIDKNQAYKDFCLIMYTLTHTIDNLYNTIKNKRDSAKADFLNKKNLELKGQYDAYHDVLCLLEVMKCK